jgi:hypothetical protein
MKVKEFSLFIPLDYCIKNTFETGSVFFAERRHQCMVYMAEPAVIPSN